MFQLLRNIDNAQVGVFGGYVGTDAGQGCHVAVVLDGSTNVERTADWEPINGRGEVMDWPKARQPRGRPVRLALTIAADPRHDDITALTDAVDALVVGEGVALTSPCQWELVEHDASEQANAR